MSEEETINSEDFFTNAACWSGGIGHEWEGDALLSGEFYAELCTLCEEHVPPTILQRFMFQWSQM